MGHRHVDAPARIRVYWQPGCTSCLRTKEFLPGRASTTTRSTREDDPGARDELSGLGARGLPVVSRGQRTRCASRSATCCKFLNLA